MLMRMGVISALFLWVSAIYYVYCEDLCKDDIANCEDFDNSTCQSFRVWSEEHCAKYCGFCKDTVQQDCPEGWSHFEGDQTCIKVFGKDDAKKRLTWAKSRKACLDMSGDLVQIRDKEKNSFVLDLLGGEKGLFMWIGLWNTYAFGFEFQYVDGSPLGSYHPWLPGNPDNMFGLERCVCMHPKGSYSGQWNDLTCDRRIVYACSLPSNDNGGTV